MTFLSDFLVTEQELTNVSAEARQKIDELLSGDDRLHCFMQLYEVARTAVEALESTDKSGFIDQISRDLEKIRSDLDRQLAEKASEVQKKFNELQDKVAVAETELQVRGACIESVLNGMGKSEDFKGELESIRTQMAEIEHKMVALKEIRQSAQFIEMCNMVSRES